MTDKSKPHRVVDAEGKSTVYLGAVHMSFKPKPSAAPAKKEEK